MSDHRNGPGFVVGLECPSGKVGFVTRKKAKRFVNGGTIRGDHMRPYICEDCGYWHNGHVPSQVMRGNKTARQVYSRRHST